MTVKSADIPWNFAGREHHIAHPAPEGRQRVSEKFTLTPIAKEAAPRLTSLNHCF